MRSLALAEASDESRHTRNVSSQLMQLTRIFRLRPGLIRPLPLDG